MAVDPSRLQVCIEETLFRLPKGAPGVVPLAFKGVRGRRTPVSSPFVNLIGVSEPNAEIPDDSIDAVLEEFGSHKMAFGWLVGPNSPKGLGARLADKGIARVEEFSGLALTNLELEIPSPTQVTIREIGGAEQEQYAELLARAYGLPPEPVEFLSKVLFFAESEIQARNYLAYEEGVTEPVAAASTLYDPNEPIVILSGSAVLERHRGKGIYRALVRRRIEDVKSQGIEAAVIQAVKATSAPICKSLGFEEVCGQDFHAWMPG